MGMLAKVLAFGSLVLTLAVVPSPAEKFKFDKDLFLQCKDGHRHTHKIDFIAHELANKELGTSQGLAMMKKIFSHREIKEIAPNLKRFALAANSLKKPLGGARPKEIKKARAWMKKHYFIRLIKYDKKFRRNLVDYYYKFAPMKVIGKARQEALDILNKRLEFGKDEKSALSQCNAFMKASIGALEMYVIDNNMFESTLLETFRDGSLWTKMGKTGYVPKKLLSRKGFYCPTCNKKYKLLPKSKERIRLSMECEEHGEFLSMTKKKEEQEKKNHAEVTTKLDRMRSTNLYIRALDTYITETGLNRCLHNSLTVHTAFESH